MNTDTLTTEQMAAVFGYTLKGRPLTTPEAAELRGLKPNTLEIERGRGSGPRYFKQGSRVLYAERDVLAWLINGARRNTSEKPGQLAAA